MITSHSEVAMSRFGKRGGGGDSLPEMSVAKWPENSSQSRTFNTINVWFPACS